MKLFWAHHEKYPEDVGYYPVKNADELMQVLASEREQTVEYIREHFLYAELSQITGTDGKKYHIELIEQD